MARDNLGRKICSSCHHPPHPHRMCSESEYSGASLTEVGPCCCMFEVTKPHEEFCICNECITAKHARQMLAEARKARRRR